MSRTVVVTGGGRGIGRAIALAFAEPGAHIVITSRTAAELEQTAADIKKKGAEATTITMDVSDEASVAHGFGTLHGRVKDVNVLVNNAGVGGGEVVQGSDVARWKQTIDTNLFGMYLVSRQLIGKPWDVISTNTANLLAVLITFFSASVVGGITTWLVSQLLAVPLRPLLLRPAFAALKKRLWPFMWTGFAASLLGVLGLVMCFLPGIYVLANLCLVGPVLMMEDLRGRAAMKRARELYKRSRRTVIAIVLIHIGAPVLMTTVASLLLLAVWKALNPQGELHANSIVTILQPLISLPITIFFSSFASVVTALLYWKTRLAGGETMKQALVQFDGEDAGIGRGQKRLRTRSRTSIRTSR